MCAVFGIFNQAPFSLPCTSQVLWSCVCVRLSLAWKCVGTVSPDAPLLGAVGGRRGSPFHVLSWLNVRRGRILAGERETTLCRKLVSRWGDGILQCSSIKMCQHKPKPRGHTHSQPHCPQQFKEGEIPKPFLYLPFYWDTVSIEHCSFSVYKDLIPVHI